MTILIEGIHAIRPLTAAAFARYVDFYGGEIAPVLERHGFELLGAFQRSGGPLGRDLVLMRFASVSEYERASASLAADARIGAAFETLQKSVQVSETTKLARPVSYATEQRLEHALAESPEQPRQYGQAILQVTPTGQRRAIDLIGRLADEVEERDALRLVTAYQTVVGPRSELTDLWLHPRGMPPLDYPRDDPLAHLVEPLREVAPEESFYWLNPLPYSPLQ